MEAESRNIVLLREALGSGRAVREVPQKGMSYCRQMNTNLVRPPCRRLTGEQGGALRGTDGLVDGLGSSRPPRGEERHRNSRQQTPSERGIDTRSTWRGHASNDGEVALSHRAILELPLQEAECLAISREQKAS